MLWLPLAWADPPSGNAELRDAALEAARRIRRCEGRQLQGNACEGSASDFGEASLTVAIAAVVLDGTTDSEAVANTWALAPDLAGRWTDLLGEPAASPSDWVAGVLDPSSIPEPEPGPRPARYWGRTVMVDPEPIKLGRVELGGASTRVSFAVLRGAQMFTSYPESFVAWLWRGRLHGEVPLGRALVAGSVAATRMRHRTGETMRSSTARLEVGVPLTLHYQQPWNAGIQLRWALGATGWSEGTSYREDERLRQTYAATPAARFGLGLTTRAELDYWAGPVSMRFTFRQTLLHRWFPVHHLDARRGAVLTSDRDGWLLQESTQLAIGAHVAPGWSLWLMFDVGMGLMDDWIQHDDPDWKLLSPGQRVDADGGLVLEWSLAAKRRGTAVRLTGPSR